MFYFAHCMNIIFNSLMAQLVKYDVHTTRKIKSIHSIFIRYYILFCVICKALIETRVQPLRIVLVSSHSAVLSVDPVDIFDLLGVSGNSSAAVYDQQDGRS